MNGALAWEAARKKMQAAYRLELTDEYLKEAQRRAIAQNAGLRLIY
jgi:hypothetical protein